GSGRWLKNSPDTNDKMYPNAIDRFRHAGSELECLTWIQGEADGEGGALWNPAIYRAKFAELMQDFASDLGDAFPPFHLQISGFSGPSGSSKTYPEVREAQRVLPPSTLVGTAVGRPLWDSAFHYTVATYQAVGQMFAGAVLKNLYGMSAPMYPPLMPDTVATLDSITDGSIMGRYCFSIGWTRGGMPVPLTSVRPDQYFALTADGIPLDTSLVWYRISPRDPSRVQIGLRNDSITLNYNWLLTYDATAGGERAPLATIDPTTGDTIFATAFYELPVELSSGPPASVKEFSVQSVVPNPAANAIHCYLYSYKHETMTVELLNTLGVMLRSESAVVEEGLQDIPISTDGVASGNYWIVLRDENGNESIQRAVFFH
ncbi:MAG TPA: sialate O-acetylesterase, partial [Candidatus Kapabacteria bacterium]|nr:sialate O-acetylesterase [Candidatus Kapabacteria bacterium]